MSRPQTAEELKEVIKELMSALYASIEVHRANKDTEAELAAGAVFKKYMGLRK